MFPPVAELILYLGKKIGEGEISVNPRRVMSCMRTLQVNNTINGAADQLQFKLEFAKFLMRETWDIFSPFSRSNRCAWIFRVFVYCLMILTLYSVRLQHMHHIISYDLVWFNPL